ncbi:MAG: pyrroline-5-carboxylate reductase [Tetrasphaera jenkinsii]|uniref:Pyrroline-5-carboxylate reductase n=1 Tax=Nostocoides jenkinsii Ben 74 TaxID=1193518 RepID=A0A077MC87_9MICO|nr:pyrroline-5-carboxylate reductase [Tetrasphaera jenkinsii]MCI1261045.1 pyrroline-5-carboxylate reductase [Tetrasphaera jenkinsii]CCI54254.1 Pyrroline-5-carboxylate reductase [Tetrasphaera jenkinsii Ben 74]
MSIAIVGGGAMGEAVVAGLVRTGSDAIVIEKRAERAAELTERYGVSTSGELGAIGDADTVLVVVKPQDADAVTREIAAHLAPGAVVVSLAAGISAGFLEARLPGGAAVVRVMPNTPALVGEGMAAVSRGAATDDEQLARAVAVLQACGRVVEVPESQQDAVTAVSGSGPAYVFHLAEALIEAGVVQGLPRATARELAVQTLLGAATMLRETGEHPSLLRERVTSPGGTTAAALRVLDERAVRGAYVAAVAAARERSAELGTSS